MQTFVNENLLRTTQLEELFICTLYYKICGILNRHIELS